MSSLTYNFYTGNGSLDTFAITFNYLDTDHIHVYLDDTEVFSPATWSQVGSDIVFVSPPAASVAVKIIRQTPRTLATRIVDFTNGSLVTESDLDTSAIQLLYICQEAFETATTGDVGSDADFIKFSVSLDGYDAATERIVRVADPISATDAVNKQYIDGNYLPDDSGTWDAGTQKIKNVVDPALSQDAATKKYVDDIATWGSAGQAEVYSLTTTTGVNTYTLTGLENVETNMVVLSLGGVIQIPGVDFTVTSGSPNSTLVLVETPDPDLVVAVQNFGKKLFIAADAVADGTITTVKLADGSVTTAKLADLAVTNAKLDNDSITTSKIQDAAVTADKLDSDAVKTDNILALNVTEAKLAAKAVSYDKLKTTGFATAPATSTDQFIAIDGTTGAQSKKQIATTDLTDFNSALAAKPIDTFASAEDNVSMGTGTTDGVDRFKVTNMAAPTSDNDATTKKYVDDSLAGSVAAGARGPYLLADMTMGSAAATYDVVGVYDANYAYYEVVITNMTTTSSPQEPWVRLKDQISGTFKTSYNGVGGISPGVILIHDLTGSGNIYYATFKIFGSGSSTGEKLNVIGQGITNGAGYEIAGSTVDTNLRFDGIRLGVDSGTLLSGVNVKIYAYSDL